MSKVLFRDPAQRGPLSRDPFAKSFLSNALIFGHVFAPRETDVGHLRPRCTSMQIKASYLADSFVTILGPGGVCLLDCDSCVAFFQYYYFLERKPVPPLVVVFEVMTKVSVYVYLHAQVDFRKLYNSRTYMEKSNRPGLRLRLRFYGHATAKMKMA